MPIFPDPFIFRVWGGGKSVSVPLTLMPPGPLGPGGRRNSIYLVQPSNLLNKGTIAGWAMPTLLIGLK